MVVSLCTNATIRLPLGQDCIIAALETAHQTVLDQLPRIREEVGFKSPS